ncbi:MAG TPA: glycosyltransferase family 4 protein [Gaiellaceae bacterium]|jgi:glycosyltransferase involved in cell wall biosynthesis|nr:glycosyltransferase family 4 protein [Gaiellaceae bacterium]
MKVAYFSPMPPSHSGIADYSALLLPALRERIEEIAIAEPGKRAPSADVALYQIGNSPDAHGWIVDALRKRPGVVVLHELVLHHLISGITLGRGNGRAYLDAMERDFGVTGRLIGLGVLDNLLPLIWETQPERFPLTGTILDLATGIIVHSEYVERGAREAGYGGPVWRIPHPAWPETEVVPEPLSGEPLIGCFGHLNINKRIPALLQAFSLLRKKKPGARLLLVGEATERFDLDRRLERLGIGGEALIREHRVSEERFESLMAACDVLVNLRSPTMGETSGSVIRGLALGKPMLVSDVGWFSELPDGVALKIPVDDYEVPTIAAALELAVSHAAELGSAAREYIRTGHDLDASADAYTKALEEAAGGAVVRDAVLMRIAEAASEIGYDDPATLARLAREAGLV